MEAIIKKLEELRNYKDELNDRAFMNCDIDYSISLIQTQTTIETLEWVLQQDFGINPCRIVHEQNLREDFIEGCETWLRRKLTLEELIEIDDYVLDETLEEMFDVESKCIIDFCTDLDEK